MVAIHSSTPVNMTGVAGSNPRSISYREGPEPIAMHQGHDGELGIPNTGGKAKPSVLRFTKSFGARRKVAPLIPGRAPSTPKVVPELPVRQKHVSTPSPLRHTSEPSADAAEPPRSGSTLDAHANARPQPSHHGHSRHSLLLTKLVWSTRQAQHSGGSSDVHSPGEPSPVSPTSPQGFASHARRAPLLRCLSSFYSEEKKSDQPPLTSYPRQGDMAALRDPYCSRADRSFAPVPLWTLNKITFLLALLTPRPRQDESDSFDDAGSEASFNGTESTLVDSDSEWDLSTTCSSRQDTSDPEDATLGYSKSDGSPPVSKDNLLSLAARQVNREPDASTVHMTNPRWLCSFYRNPRPDSIKLSLAFSRNRHQRNQSASLSSTTWPSNWYGLWEVLIELAHRDAATNVGERGRMPEAKGLKKVVTVPQPKEFRWLKMLGGVKPGAANLKGSLKATGKLSSARPLSPAAGFPRPVVYEPSHSACG